MRGKSAIQEKINVGGFAKTRENVRSVCVSGR